MHAYFSVKGNGRVLRGLHPLKTVCFHTNMLAGVRVFTVIFTVYTNKLSYLGIYVMPVDKCVCLFFLNGANRNYWPAASNISCYFLSRKISLFPQDNLTRHCGKNLYVPNCNILYYVYLLQFCKIKHLWLMTSLKNQIPGRIGRGQDLLPPYFLNGFII